MASNLRVDQITASTAGSVSIGTATFTGGLSGSITGLNVTGVITATTLNQNVSGILTAQNGIHVTGGSVGIGTDNPSQKLNVSGNIMLDGSDQYCYLSNVGTFNSGIYVRGRTATSELRSHSTGIFTWEVTGNEKMRITSDGKIGINNTNPTYDVDLLKTTSGVGATMRVGSTAASGVNNASVIINNGGTGDAALDFKYESAATPRASIYVYRSDQELRFDTAGSEAARFTSTGNLKFPSGQGIDFSATADGSGTTTSELLDDYEEGTWTAALGDDSNTTGSATGKYTKIGDVVFLTISIGNVNTGTLTGSQDLRVTGLPFAPVETNFRGAGTVSLDNVSFSGYVTTEISGGSYLKLVESSSGSGGDRIIVSQYTSGSADLWISLSYKTSA